MAAAVMAGAVAESQAASNRAAASKLRNMSVEQRVIDALKAQDEAGTQLAREAATELEGRDAGRCRSR